MNARGVAAADWLKAVCAQLIVLHHLALYGPMADHAWPLAPALFAALAEHGRYAVQAFLVLGGFFAARSLAPEGRWRCGQRLFETVRGRYLRLAMPLAPVLLLAAAAALLARAWMDHPATPQAPQAWQIAAHLLLLQDLFGMDALSAGLWYVAVDLQLFALLSLLLALASRLDARLDRWRDKREDRRGDARRLAAEPVAPWLVLVGMAVSALWINRWPAWDLVAPYFLAAYGLGALVHWWGGRPARMLLVASILLSALWLDWRVRLALAGAVALLLWLQRRQASSAPAPVAWLARIGYAQFLVHYPVGLVVNALFERWLPHQPWLQAGGVVLAWLASVAAGAVFHHRVEPAWTRHLQRWWSDGAWRRLVPG